MNTTSFSASRRRRQGGYGLLEMVISIAIMSLVFLGATFLLDTSARTAARTQAQIYASGDAANSIQSVVSVLREADSFTLPVGQAAGVAETGWIVPSGTTATQFYATLSGQAFATAVEITAPGPLTPAYNGYKAGVTDISVQSSSGAALVLNPNKAPYAQTPYYNGAVGTTTSLIYRGDPDGTPDADPTNSPVAGAGTCLWQYKLLPDGTRDPVNNPNVKLCKSVASASNAVQFVRPVFANAASANQVEVKIISGYYSPINGQQTNEEGNGATSQPDRGQVRLYAGPPDGRSASDGGADRQHAVPVSLAGGAGTAGAASSAPTQRRIGQPPFQRHTTWDSRTWDSRTHDSRTDGGSAAWGWSPPCL